MEGSSEKENEIEEAIADLFLKLNDHLISLQSGTSNHSYHSRVTLNGKNVGATTIIHPSNREGEPGHYFGINIYVNNNVQGVDNSILLESSVSMRNPGVCLSLPNLPARDIGGGPHSKRRKKRKKATWHRNDGGYGITLFCIVTLFLILLFCIS